MVGHHPWRRILLGTVLAAAVPLVLLAPRARGDSTLPDPLPAATAQTRAAELIQPATAWVTVAWQARITIPTYGELRERWRVRCGGFVVDSAGYLVTAGQCLDAGWDGAQRVAARMAVDDLIRRGRLSESDREAVTDAVGSGALHWRVEGAANGSLPDRDVSVVVGAATAPTSTTGTSDDPVAVTADVIEVRPRGADDVALLQVAGTDLPVALLSADPAPPSTESVVGAPGHNGGPVTDLHGRVVGLSSTAPDGRAVVVPSTVIAPLLTGRAQNVAGHLDRLYRLGLDAYYRGYYTDAVHYFDRVLSIRPGLQPAVDKRTAAAHRKNLFGDRPKPAAPRTAGGSPLPVLPGLTALGLLAVPAALLLMREPPARHARRRPLPRVPRRHSVDPRSDDRSIVTLIGTSVRVEGDGDVRSGDPRAGVRRGTAASRDGSMDAGVGPGRVGMARHHRGRDRGRPVRGTGPIRVG